MLYPSHFIFAHVCASEKKKERNGLITQIKKNGVEKREREREREKERHT